VGPISLSNESYRDSHAGPVRGVESTIGGPRGHPYSVRLDRVAVERGNSGHISETSGPTNGTGLGNNDSSDFESVTRSQTRSQTSTSSDGRRPINLQELQGLLQFLPEHLRPSEHVLQMAQSLFQLPDEHGWKVSVLLMITCLQNMSPGAGLSPTQRGSNGLGTSVNSRMEFGPALKSYLRVNIRQILLREDIECYGRRTAQKTHSAKSPFGLIKQKLDNQGPEFHEQHFPPNYSDNAEITTRLDSLISFIVKAEKTNLASLIRTGLTKGEPLEPVPQLSKLVTEVYTAMDHRFRNRTHQEINSDPTITVGAKVRLAYLRFIFNQHRIQLARNSNHKTPSVWDMVDQDLQVRRKQPQTARFAFAELVLEHDRNIWDGTKTIDDIPEESQQLPTAHEVAARVKQYNTQPEASNTEPSK